jgi:sn-glycerol 3-phosphate transport system substrate-binding protein
VATRQSSYHVADMKAHVEKNPQYLVARDQLKYASAKMMAPSYQKIREILKRQLDDAVDAKVSPREAMDAVQKQVTPLIAR